jgi:hypothetical protein
MFVAGQSDFEYSTPGGNPELHSHNEGVAKRQVSYQNAQK